MSDKKWNTWVWVKWKPGTPTEIWQTWQKNTEVENAWSTLGDWDCVMSLKSSDPAKAEDWVWKELRSNQWVEKTHTTQAKQWW